MYTGKEAPMVGGRSSLFLNSYKEVGERHRQAHQCHGSPMYLIIWLRRFGQALWDTAFESKQLEFPTVASEI